MERSPVSENRSPVKVHESHTTPENDDVLGNEADNNLMEEVEEEASVGHADKKIKLFSESDVKSCGDFEVSKPRHVVKGESSAPIERQSSFAGIGHVSYSEEEVKRLLAEAYNNMIGQSSSHGLVPVIHNAEEVERLVSEAYNNMIGQSSSHGLVPVIHNAEEVERLVLEAYNNMIGGRLEHKNVVLSEPRNVEKGNSSAPIEDESSVNNVGDGSYCAKPKSCFKVESVNRTEEGVDLGNENHDEVQPTIPSKRLCFIEAALKVINAKLDEMWACNCRLFDAITLCEKCLRPDSTGDFASMLKIESFVEACDAATNSVTPTTDSSAYQQLLAIISPQTSKRLMEATVRLQPREELNIICRKNNWAAPIYYLLPPTDVGIQYLVSVEGMDFVYSEFGEIETDIDKAKDSGAEKILAKLREMVAR